MMNETINLSKSATVSAFQNQIDRGFITPQVQFIEIWRRAKERGSDKILSLENQLTKGLVIGINGLKYIAEVNINCDVKIPIKKLSRTVNKSTKSPKTSRGTIYRRNSTTIERRVPAKNWADGQKAKEQTIFRQKVFLIPFNLWAKRQEELKQKFRKEEGQRIAVKRDSRVAKAMSQWKGESTNELLVKSIMNLIESISEKNGIRNNDEMQRRLTNNLDNNLPQSLVFIWGPPYERQGITRNAFAKNQPEIKMLQDIVAVIDSLEKTVLQILPILIYADIYGAQINGISDIEVQNYLEDIKQNVPDRFCVIQYSEILNQNSNLERFILENVTPNAAEIRSATKIQSKLGRNLSPAKASELALIYKKTRLYEGQLLTNGFTINGVTVDNIIKLATAPSKEKDDPYEPELPRFYVKNMIRAAWNKSRKG